MSLEFVLLTQQVDMTPEEEERYVEELAQKGYENAVRIEALFDELTLESARFKERNPKTERSTFR